MNIEFEVFGKITHGLYSECRQSPRDLDRETCFKRKKDKYNTCQGESISMRGKVLLLCLDANTSLVHAISIG